MQAQIAGTDTNHRYNLQSEPAKTQVEPSKKSKTKAKKPDAAKEKPSGLKIRIRMPPSLLSKPKTTAVPASSRLRAAK